MTDAEWLGLGLAVVGGGVLGWLFWQSQSAASKLATQNAQLTAQVAADQQQIGQALAGNAGSTTPGTQG